MVIPWERVHRTCETTCEPGGLHAIGCATAIVLSMPVGPDPEPEQ